MCNKVTIWSVGSMSEQVKWSKPDVSCRNSGICALDL